MSTGQPLSRINVNALSSIKNMSLTSGKYLLVRAAHLVGVFLIVKFLGYIFPFLTLYYYTGIIELITCLFVGVYTFRFSKERYLDEKVNPEGKAVLITGCDTGFGHLLAKRLDTKGFRVFACCLFPSGDGATQLQRSCSKRLQVLELDVTKQDSVKKVEEFVKENLERDELWALVNNAGITKGFSIDLSTVQDFRDCLEVNTIGPVRMTKAFLTFLKKSKGRIVNVTSQSGRITIPYFTPYTMSKYAVVAFNDCLRKELNVWGVRVISIEPDCFQTNFLNEERINEDFDSTFAALANDLKSEYGQKFLQKFKGMKKLIYKFTSPDLDIVIDSLDSAITDEYPDVVYSPRGSLITLVVFFIYRKLGMTCQDIIMKIVLYLVGFPRPHAA